MMDKKRKIEGKKAKMPEKQNISTKYKNHLLYIYTIVYFYNCSKLLFITDMHSA